MALSFVTGNAGKFREIAAVIPNLVQLDLDLDEIQGLDPQIIIEHKLKQAAEHHPGAIIVEDTSLLFECLNGLPGTNIKWFVERLGNKGMAELVHKYVNHRATARCTIGLRDEQGKVAYFTGEIRGTIVAPRGTLNPFGWNSIFQPEAHTQTFAEMTFEAKNAVSMRGQAAQALLNYLQAN